MRRPSLATLLPLSVIVITLSTQAVFLVGASFFQIGPEFGLGPLGLGLLTASFFLTAAATSAPLGRWVQRVGWQRAMVVNMRVTGVVLAAIPVLARSAWALALLLVSAAAMYGASNPAANQALADHTRLRRQATIFGAKHAGIPASTLLAGLAVPLVVERFGWRWAFVVVAILAFGVSLVIPRGALAAPIVHPPDPEDRPTARQTTRRDLLLLALGSSFATWGAITLGTYLVSATVAAGFTASAAGLLQFAGSAASITARVTVGAITDRRGAGGFGGIVLLACLGALAFLSLLFASGPVYAILVIAAFSTGWGWPGLMTYAVVRANRASVAAASGITQAGVFVGAGAVPIILGAVIERWSYEGAWVTAAFGLLVAAGLVGSVGWRVAGPGAAARTR